MAVTARPVAPLSPPVAASPPVTAPPVRVPRAVFAALETWPAALDRARLAVPWLFALGFGEQTARVRAELEAPHEWAAAHPEATTIPLPDALCEALRGWPIYMERARASGKAQLSMNELLSMEVALPVLRDLVQDKEGA